MPSQVVWASDCNDPFYTGIITAFGINHWSRRFEYPWVIKNSDFKSGHWVLDAAGGDGLIQNAVSDYGCHVVNVDIDVKSFPADSKALTIRGDISDLNFLDNTFHWVLCVSVLEHTENPVNIVRELWRVLRPGGRLVVTFDVANYRRWNHTIDLDVAAQILVMFGLSVPAVPQNVLHYCFPELNPKPGEPGEVMLQVLCFYCDK